MSVSAAQSLFWIALGALVIPMVCRRLRIPSAVGELIFGIAFGSHLLGLISPDDFIDLLAQLGFAILMFSAGMEIDFAPLKKRGSRLLGVAWQWVFLALVLALGGGWLIGAGPWPALAVCSVSIGLASVLLRERELLTSPLGQVILACGLIGESLSILLLTVLDFQYRLGFSLEFLWSVLQFTGIFILAYFLMRLFRFIIWWYPKKVGAFLESDDPLELGVRLAVALLFIFLAAAAVLGVESILGAFIAGALFGYIFQEREVISEKINAMGQGFFVPFFFIVVGSHFDPRALFAALSGTGFLELILLALAVKVLASVIFRRLGLTLREVLAGGLLFAAPLTLTVAVAEVGVRLGAVSRELQGSLILVAVIAGLIFPLLARLLLPKREKEEAKAGPENNKG